MFKMHNIVSLFHLELRGAYIELEISFHILCRTMMYAYDT